MGKSGNPTIAEAGRGTRFKKGEKPPPGAGRPHGSVSLTDAIRRAAEMDFSTKNPMTGHLETKQVRDWIGIALAGKAMKGDVAAIREALDRLEGKVKEKLEVTGKDGEPLAIEHSQRLSEAWGSIADAFQTTRLGIDEGPSKE